jgi:hypothetical protein
MSAPEKPAPPRAARDPYVELAQQIFVGLAARIYSAPSEKKPDPKALAAYSFKLAEAFEQASKETDRARAAIDIANKAAVRLDEVDLTSVFQSAAKPK